MLVIYKLFWLLNIGFLRNVGVGVLWICMFVYLEWCVFCENVFGIMVKILVLMLGGVVYMNFFDVWDVKGCCFDLLLCFKYFYLGIWF